MKTIDYAGVDWVTMTSPKDQIGMEWYSMYMKYQTEKLKEGDTEFHFNNGFYSGLGIASMRWGYSDHLGFIILISGADAERFWQHLEPGRNRVTRLDLCVDFRPNPTRLVAQELFIGVSKERKAEFPMLSLFIGPRGGDTLYVGSRHSTQFGRLYDKGVESGKEGPGVKWRVEVEYKKPLAGEMAGELILEDSVSRQQAIVDTVLHWFSDRGIEVIPENDGALSIKISMEQRITTADRKLAWLHSQVHPTVQKLISLGLGKEVLKSLALDEEALRKIYNPEICQEDRRPVHLCT